MSADWKAEISRIAHWKQLAAEHDKGRIVPWYPPSKGAVPEEISSLEQVTSIKLPSDFVEFLNHANGWKCFYVLTDLFGTRDCADGRSRDVLQRKELREFLEDSAIDQRDVLVIGASNFDLDVFLLMSTQGKVLPGGVIWFASEEVDRYKSFSSFFSAMVNYNAKIAEKLATMP